MSVKIDCWRIPGPDEGMCLPRSPNPVILDWDWTYFPELLQKLLLAQEPEEDTSEETGGGLFPLMDPDLLTFRRKKSQTQKRTERTEERVENGKPLHRHNGDHRFCSQSEQCRRCWGMAFHGPKWDVLLQLYPEMLTGFLDFRMEQRNDETLSRAFKQVAVIADKVVSLLRAWQYPHFVFKTNLLYCIDQDKQTCEI